MLADQPVYRAPWSKTLLGLSVFSTVIILGVSFLMFSLGRAVHPLLAVEGWLVLSVLPMSALFVVRSYTVRDHELWIQRLLWKTVVPLANLRDVYRDPKAMSYSWRTWGNGGCLSFTGWFYSKQLGHYRAYATDSARSVVLVLGERTMVVTPDRPDEFVEQLRHESGINSPRQSRDLESAAV